MNMRNGNRQYCDLPMVRCPHCRQEFQKDDYYDVESGNTWECPKCDKVIHVLSVDTTINVVLAKEPEE